MARAERVNDKTLYKFLDVMDKVFADYLQRNYGYIEDSDLEVLGGASDYGGADVILTVPFDEYGGGIPVTKDGSKLFRAYYSEILMDLEKQRGGVRQEDQEDIEDALMYYRAGLTLGVDRLYTSSMSGYYEFVLRYNYSVWDDDVTEEWVGGSVSLMKDSTFIIDEGFLVSAKYNEVYKYLQPIIKKVLNKEL